MYHYMTPLRKYDYILHSVHLSKIFSAVRNTRVSLVQTERKSCHGFLSCPQLLLDQKKRKGRAEAKHFDRQDSSWQKDRTKCTLFPSRSMTSEKCYFSFMIFLTFYYCLYSFVFMFTFSCGLNMVKFVFFFQFLFIFIHCDFGFIATIVPTCVCQCMVAATANYIHRSSLCDVVVYVGTAYTLVNFRFF